MYGMEIIFVLVFILVNKLTKFFQFPQNTVRLCTAQGHHLNTYINTKINKKLKIFFNSNLSGKLLKIFIQKILTIIKIFGYYK